jgi:hypothetical protein
MPLIKKLIFQCKSGNLRVFQRFFNIYKETLNTTPEEVKIINNYILKLHKYNYSKYYNKKSEMKMFKI